MLQLKLSKVEHADATDIDSGRLSTASVAPTSEMVFTFLVPTVAMPELLQTLYDIIKKTTMTRYVHTLVTSSANNTCLQLGTRRLHVHHVVCT